MARKSSDPLDDGRAFVPDPFAVARPRRALAPRAHAAEMLRSYAYEPRALTAADELCAEHIGAEPIGDRFRDQVSESFDLLLIT